MFKWIENVFEDNDTLVISGGVTDEVFSAQTWKFERGNSLISLTRKQALEFAFEHAESTFTALQPWILVGTRTLQPDNRLTRHMGLWKNLENQGINLIPNNSASISHVYEEKGGIRFSGIVKYHQGQQSDILGIFSEYDVRIVLMDKILTDSGIDDILKLNRNDEKEFLKMLIHLVCSRNGIVVDISGAFDDIDILVSFIGKRAVLTSGT